METQVNKADYNEEVSLDGRVSRSKMRQMSGIALWTAIIYLIISIMINLWFWQRIFEMIDKHLITENMMTLMISAFTGINVSVFLILIVGAFAPKAVQKFAENKLK